MTKTISQSIKLTHEDDQWVAVDEKTSIASQGDTREEALRNLDEALELTEEAREDETEALEPNAPWFE
ncbi:MAG: type II toxin-antitoxin system HicB family antitoxin [Candidatus Bipolaricaulia bacterium]